MITRDVGRHMALHGSSELIRFVDIVDLLAVWDSGPFSHWHRLLLLAIRRSICRSLFSPIHGLGAATAAYYT